MAAISQAPVKTAPVVNYELLGYHKFYYYYYYNYVNFAEPLSSRELRMRKEKERECVIEPSLYKSGRHVSVPKAVPMLLLILSVAYLLCTPDSIGKKKKIVDYESNVSFTFFFCYSFIVSVLIYFYFCTRSFFGALLIHFFSFSTHSVFISLLIHIFFNTFFFQFSFIIFLFITQ